MPVDDASDEEIARLKRAGNDLLRRHAGVLPDVVYHYTSLEVALKIVESFELWCVNVAFSNDPSEGYYGQKLVAKILAHDPELLLSGMQVLIASEIGSYVSSFSCDPDSLTQWRAYGNNGWGVSIGIDAAVLANRKNIAFSRVEYDRAKQERLVRGFLEIFREPIRRAKGDRDHLQRLVGSLALFVVMVRTVIKDPAYYPEFEWRLFDALPNDPAHHDVRLEYFARGEQQVPYFPVDLRASSASGAGQPIQDIRLGPCVAAAAARSALFNSRAYQVKPFSVSQSRVPMRCD